MWLLGLAVIVLVGGVLSQTASEFCVGHLSPTSSLVWVMLLGGALLLGVLRHGMGVYRARLLVHTASTPGDGLAVVTGKFRFAFGSMHAMRLELFQVGQGLTYRDKIYTHWKEVSRSKRFSPFYVELESGDRIRVEPTEEAILVDAIQMERSEGTPVSARELPPLRRANVSGFVVMLRQGTTLMREPVTVEVAPRLRSSGARSIGRSLSPRFRLIQMPEERCASISMPLSCSHF